MAEVVDTAIGRVYVELSAGGIRGIHIGARGPASEARSPIAKDLRRYASGERVDFRGYDLDLSGCTEFERRVYRAARKIPAGEVRTYGEIARAIRQPGAARAVGNALGKNPVGIVIPCHRVVASDGIGGFTGGLEWKRKLLRLEGSLGSAENAKERR